MTTSRRFAALVLFFAAALSMAWLQAAPAPRQAEPGFTQLFNGKDLTGWVYGQRANGTENKTGKGYQIENGVLYSTKDDGGNLYTGREYANFVLRFEFRLTENANNGIGIRSPLAGDAAYVGMEIQVLDDGGSMYTKLEPGQYHGSIYKVAPAKRGFQKPVGEWNTQEIVAERPADHHHAQRHGDCRREPRRGDGPGRAEGAPRSDETRGLARDREREGPHRVPRPRRARRVPQHPHQGAIGTPATRASGCGSCPGCFHLCSGELRLSSLCADGKPPGHPRVGLRVLSGVFPSVLG